VSESLWNAGPTEPLISIIIPTYNAAPKLAPTLKSALAEAGADLREIIVVDGSSTDRTSDLISSETSNAPESVFQMISEPDTGIYDAMNKGIRLARGKFLYFLGAGDVLQRTALCDIQMTLVREAMGGPSLVYGNVDWNGQRYDGPFNRFKLATRNICHQAIFYHRDVFRLLGDFDIRYHTHADYVFNMRCFASREIRKIYVDSIIAHFESGGRSGADDDTAFSEARPALIRRHLGILPLLYRRRSLLYSPLLLLRKIRERAAQSSN
jgi:glycosyltransferase involved in cell wall biosynthesis